MGRLCPVSVCGVMYTAGDWQVPDPRSGVNTASSPTEDLFRQSLKVENSRNWFSWKTATYHFL